jgi:ankyrin repeat protein
MDHIPTMEPKPELGRMPQTSIIDGATGRKIPQLKFCNWQTVSSLQLTGVAAGEKGRTKLMIAAEEGLVDVCESLVAEGADLNARDSVGMTALLYAADQGHAALVRVLLRSWGADATIKTNAGSSATLKAACKGHLDVLEVLDSERVLDVKGARNDGATALQATARNGHEDVVKWLTEKGGADVQAADARGNTALMLAAGKGFLHLGKPLDTC